MTVHGDGGHRLGGTVHRDGNLNGRLPGTGGGEVHGQGEDLAVIGSAGGDGHLSVPAHIELILGAGEHEGQIPQAEIGLSVPPHKGGGRAGLVQIGDLHVVHKVQNLGAGVQVEAGVIGGVQLAVVHQGNQRGPVGVVQLKVHTGNPPVVVHLGLHGGVFGKIGHNHIPDGVGGLPIPLALHQPLRAEE